MAGFYLNGNIDVDLARLLAPFGHDALTTLAAGRRLAGDEEQLVFAATAGRILVTHNSKDFKLLQRAWRYWSDVWAVEPRPRHAGILAVAQSPTIGSDRLAREIDAFV